MIVLTINNSESKIEGLSVCQFAEVRDLLSYKISDQQKHFSHTHNDKRYLINKRGEFPSGLVELVKFYLKSIGNLQQYRIIDSRVKPESKPGMFVLNLKE